jgi:hypothetical protein
MTFFNFIEKLSKKNFLVHFMCALQINEFTEEERQNFSKTQKKKIETIDVLDLVKCQKF